MKKKVRIWATLVGILIGALAYWFQPYNQTTILGINMWIVMSIGAFFGSLILMIFINEKTDKVATLISLGVIIAILSRKIYDTTFWDSTSHNLAPIEILICGIVTVPSAFLGAFLGVLIKKKKNNNG